MVRARLRPRRSKDRLLTIDGETMSIVMWAVRYGIRPATIHARLRKGWSPREAVTTPLLRRYRMRRNG